MKSLSSHIPQAFSSVKGAAGNELRKALRIGEVRALWADLVEDAILQHTNGVYIFKEDEKTVMHVYMDESIYAAELNNRRELIQLQCMQHYGQVIDEFQIHISYGIMKQRYPFREETKYLPDQNPPIPLSEHELQQIKEICSAIQHIGVREEFEKAMIADLEWKKGNPQ